MIAVVCVALLVIIFFLDSFNATVYSVGGKDVKDATDEARDPRHLRRRPAGRHHRPRPRCGRALAGGFVLYRDRDAATGREEDDGEDVDFEDLGGE